MKSTSKKRGNEFVFFSLCVNETTDIRYTAQLAIFLRGVKSNFEYEENLLSLESLDGTTRGEDLFQKVLSALEKFNFPLSKLSGIATDGAPAMVGSKKGLVALMKSEMTSKGINADNLVVCHCVIHRESLCAKSLKFDNVTSVVTECIKFIKRNDLNNRIFKHVLEEFNADYDDLIYYCAVRWTSTGNMLARFNSLLNEVAQFMEMKGRSVTELRDCNWLCDFGFMVDISKYLTDLNIQLQGPDQLLHTMFAKIKAFMSMLNIWKDQLKSNNTASFPTLRKFNPANCIRYANECAKLAESFESRFTDMKAKEIEINFFATPFNVDPCVVPQSLQLEIVCLQSDISLKAMYLNKSLPVFYNVHVTQSDFPKLRRNALKYISVFGSTYLCEQFFFKTAFYKVQIPFTAYKQKSQSTIDNFQ